MEAPQKKLFEIAFGETVSDTCISSQSDFKTLYSEQFLLKTSRSRRERLFGGRRQIVKHQIETQFDSDTYKAMAKEVSARAFEKRYRPSVYQKTLKAVKLLLSPISVNKRALKRDIDTLLTSELFSAEWYAEKYEIKGTHRTLAKHYLLVGYTRLYDPSPAFSTQKYLAKYPDVTMSCMNPLLHFITCGKAEKRSFA